MKKSIIENKEGVARCGICFFGTVLPDGSGILCSKSGIRMPDSSCKKFSYDPLKRVPRREPELQEFSPEDFSL